MDNSADIFLRENEIRPNSLMKGQAEAFASDIRRLLKNKNNFVHVLCPACRADNTRKAFEKFEMSYVVCLDCETMYINPRPTPEILEMYYASSENYKYWNKYIFPASEQARREKIYRPRAERVVDICQRNRMNTGLLLEVGAAFGTFCEEVKRIGIFKRVIAVEPTPKLAETCRRKGLEVIEKPIEKVHLQIDAIDVVVSFEVIEHLFSPRDFLNSCSSVMQPGGLLVLTCPNVKGFDIVILKALSDSIDVEHLNYFHPESLSHLVEDCGFETLEVLTPGKLDAELVRKKILTGDFDISSQPFLKQILIDEWEKFGNKFQKFLADNLLSSHMWMVARKIS